MAIKVIPKDGNVKGKTLPEYIVEFWQALCPIPKGNNPAWLNDGKKDKSFNDSVGADLYMLSPSMNPQATVTRKIEVPSGKGLFIPVVPVEVSECETDLPLIAAANKDQASIHPPSLSLKLDGSPIDLDPYKFKANDIDEFEVNFPAPNDAIFKIKEDFTGPCNARAAGRYVWTEPLSPGEHTVQYSGELHCAPPGECIETNYKENITYNITVS